MTVKLLFFSVLRDRMGLSESECEVFDGESVLEIARRILEPVTGSLEWEKFLRFAVADEYVHRDYKPRDGDEIALIPPVAGG